MWQKRGEGGQLLKEGKKERHEGMLIEIMASQGSRKMHQQSGHQHAGRVKTAQLLK